MSEITIVQAVFVGLLFVWSGFVRSGIGFGGAALSLPLLLLIIDEPLFWLPIVATHLLIFSCLTLYKRLDNVDWDYLKKALWVIFIPKIAGVLGLLNFPSEILVIMIYGITFIYGLTYMFNYSFKSENRYIDRTLLILGGYASGVSLIGAPLISAVFVRHVELSRLRDTLFVLWIILVLIKMSTFIAFEIDMQFKYMIFLLPFVTVGHLLGLKAHSYLIHGQGGRFKKILNELANDGRVPITVLAERIGISKTPCQKRLNRLISDGYITGFKAIINPKMMAMNHTAFIQVKLKSTTKDALLKFNQAVNTIPEIVQCHLIASSFDYLLKVRTTDIDAYRRVLTESISTLPFIDNTSTHISLEAIKENDYG